MNPVIAMLIGVVVMMVLVICTRMHAFPSLIISAILIAVLSGNYLLVGTGNEGGNLLSVAISTVTGGFGGTMTSIGIVIGFGCIMGIFLEKSGAAKRMAITILKLVGVKRADVVLGLTGFVVSIPVFCDSGFVILSSLAKEFSRLTKKSMVGLGGILGMGLYITHFMVPPTPGPLAVVSTFQNEGINIDLGMFIIAGLLFSIPLFVFSVFLFRWFGNKYPQFVVPYEIDRSKYTEAQLKVLDKIDAKIKAGKELENEDFTELLSTEKLPSAGLSFTILLLPVFLILANTLVSQTAFKATIVGEIITFLGNPVIALFISLCLGAFLLASGTKGKRFVLPNSMVLIHQPSGGAQGQQTEIEIVAEEIKKTRRELNQILSDASGQPIEKVQADTERDNYLTAAEALDYGLIDRIVTSRDLAAKDA